MSRFVALVAVAATAFAFAPRPVGVLPDSPAEADESEFASVGLDPVDLDIGGPWTITTDEEPLPERLDCQPREDADDPAPPEPVVAPPPRNPGEKVPVEKPRLEDPEIQKRVEELRKLLETIDKPGPGDRSDDPPAPPAFPGRYGATRAKLLKESGANETTERATALGLAWLARQQLKNGSWAFDGDNKDDTDDTVAATGLALLPFLGAGQTHKPDKDDTEKKYQKAVGIGLGFLVKNCPPSGPNAGRMSTNMHAQAFATLALCEAYGMTKDPVLKPYAQAALNYIQKAQAKDGGWADTADGKSDIAVTGWVVQAFLAARVAKDLVVDGRVLKRAITFRDSVAGGKRKAEYGTTDNTDAKPGTTPTATGLWCRYHIDAWSPSHPGTVEGVAGLMKNPPHGKPRDPLYLYYATWVVARYEGADWKDWNEGPKNAEGVRKDGMRDLLTGSQVRKDGATLGSWDVDGEWGKRYGRLGTTALNALTLEVYYRYLPLYKRGSDGGATKIIEDDK